MSVLPTLLLTDVVDRTKLVETLGDAAMAGLWARHERGARDLLAEHGGREIDKTDGLLLLFDAPADAAAYAVAYHQAIAPLGESARAGLHVGPVVLRDVQNRYQLALLLGNRAELEVDAGDLDTARTALVEAEALVEEMGAAPRRWRDQPPRHVQPWGVARRSLPVPPTSKLLRRSVPSAGEEGGSPCVGSTPSHGTCYHPTIAATSTGLKS